MPRSVLFSIVLSLAFLPKTFADPQCSKHLVMIVDVVSSARDMAIDFHKMGIEIIEGISPSYPTKLAEAPLDDGIFKETFDFRGKDQSEIEAALKGFGLQAIISGTDTAPETVDPWSKRLNLPTNGTRFTEHRRKKELMQKVWREAGIQTISGIASERFEEILEWVHIQVQGWPAHEPLQLNRPYTSLIRLKPTEGAAGDGQANIHNDEELLDNFNRILNTPNFFGEKSLTVLAQRYLHSEIFDEYIVEGVSRYRDFLPPIFFKYDKTEVDDGRSTMNRTRWLLPPLKNYQDHNAGDEVEDKRTLYILNRLQVPKDARKKLFEMKRRMTSTLDILHGASHSEIFLSKDGKIGPLPGETAPRPGGSGGMLAQLARMSMGFHEFEGIAHAYLDEEKFNEMKNAKLEYSPAALILMKSVDGTRAISRSIGEKIRALASFQKDLPRQLVWNVPEGERVVTKTMMSAPGKFILMNRDIDQLLADYQSYLDWEAAGELYAK